jgi:pilus assembly protein Flp/PilA
MEDSQMALIETVVSRLRRTEGQGLAEYALILALIAIVVIAALSLLGGSINSALNTVGNSI